MRLEMTVDEFYSDSAAQTNFVDRMAAFLNISYDRIRIVGLRSSSGRRELLSDGINETIIEFVVIAENGIPGRASNGYSPDVNYIEL